MKKNFASVWVSPGTARAVASVGNLLEFTAFPNRTPSCDCKIELDLDVWKLEQVGEGGIGMRAFRNQGVPSDITED